VTIAITGCFILIVLLMTGRLQRRSNRIAAAISSFRENQQDVDVVVDEHDEILYVIAKQFNKMTSDITVMVSELRAKNEHIAAATDQRRKAEIRALQAQINPHFLYNALDRINWMAIDNEQDEISEMLVGLASLLRYSISNIDILVPLKAEIQWMEKYLLVQGKRFEREIKFDCSVYGDAIDFPIYKMLMQPLVENSVLHGFAMRPNGNRIRLDAHILDDARLRLVLSDNGIGMDGTTLSAIRQQISEQRSIDRSIANAPDEPGSVQEDEGGIGIHNVIERLWLYYGREGDIYVESVSGQGTSFILTIPYREHA
ncbi:MAG TPA: histidine kinase, partial [Clostridia bacterium]